MNLPARWINSDSPPGCYAIGIRGYERAHVEPSILLYCAVGGWRGRGGGGNPGVELELA